MRLVLDTNIVVSGLIWGGLPRRLLDLAREGHATLFTSSGLLDELAGLLSRDKFEAMLASQGITPDFLMQRYGERFSMVNRVLPCTHHVTQQGERHERCNLHVPRR